MSICNCCCLALESPETYMLMVHNWMWCSVEPIAIMRLCFFVNAYKFILIFSLYSCFLSTSCIPLIRFEENIAYIKLAHTKHPSVRWKRKKNKKAGMSTSALHEVCVIAEVEASRLKHENKGSLFLGSVIAKSTIVSSWGEVDHSILLGYVHDTRSSSNNESSNNEDPHRQREILSKR